MMQVVIFFLTFVIKMFKCKHCKNTYKHRGSLTNHLRSHEGPRHECDVCRKKFIRRSYLLKHIDQHHTDQSGPPGDSVSDTRAPEPTPGAHTTTMVVPVKIIADKYDEFVDFLKNCKCVYQEEVCNQNDLETLNTNEEPEAPMAGMAPPSAYPLRLPPEPVWEECLGIPTARHILEGTLSPLYDPGTLGAHFDLGTSEAEREFLTQLEQFINEL
jgi:hypothetical protein